MLNTKAISAIVVAIAMAAVAETAHVAEVGNGMGLDWLAGHWCGGEGARIDEVWLPEAGGTLIGMSRTVRAGKAASFEFMRIVPEDGRPVFQVQPNGARMTTFAIAERGDGWIRFENVEHDFPNRIEYRRIGDRLDAWIAGPGPDGKELRIPFGYRACGLVGS